MRPEARVAFCVFLLTADSGSLCAETVEVDYHGDVDLVHFACTEIAPGSRVRRVCYDDANRYLVVRHQDSWRHFCAVDAAIAARLLAAPAIDRFFGSMIEGRHACRPDTLPQYEDDVPQPAEAQAE
ncbi:MAG: KTSC domain-containing protein [Pseudomonadota bacterium]|nr:KTSC domain-containing protein [Pseudomonadota bacterium]